MKIFETLFIVAVATTLIIGCDDPMMAPISEPVIDAVTEKPGTEQATGEKPIEAMVGEIKQETETPTPETPETSVEPETPPDTTAPTVTATFTTGVIDAAQAMIGDTVTLTLISDEEINIDQSRVWFSINGQQHGEPVTIALTPETTYTYTASFMIDENTPKGPVGFAFTPRDAAGNEAPALTVADGTVTIGTVPVEVIEEPSMPISPDQIRTAPEIFSAFTFPVEYPTVTAADLGISEAEYEKMVSILRAETIQRLPDANELALNAAVAGYLRFVFYSNFVSNDSVEVRRRAINDRLEEAIRNTDVTTEAGFIAFFENQNAILIEEGGFSYAFAWYILIMVYKEVYPDHDDSVYTTPNPLITAYAGLKLLFPEKTPQELLGYFKLLLRQDSIEETQRFYLEQ